MPPTAPPPPPPPPPFGGAPGRFGGAPPSAFGTPGGELLPPPARRTRGPLFWMGAGCLGCLGSLVLLIAVVGGVGLYLTHGPVDAVQHQIREIRAGDLRAAYERLTDEHRARLPYSDFEALVAAHPALRDNSGSLFWERSIDNDGARLVGRLTARDGRSERVRYALRRQGGSWRIAEIAIGEGQ
jgi:hypothetical protein